MPLPETLRARSPSGSRHFYFLTPNDGREVRNDTGKRLGPGIDIRGEGGMVVAPPSIKDGQCYIWENEDTQPVQAPAWLLDKVAFRPIPMHTIDPDQDLPSIKLVKEVVKFIPTALEWHERNSIGMAIFSATVGSQEGLEVWCEWLARSGKFSYGHAVKRWKALHRCPPSRISFGSLHHLANVSTPEFMTSFDSALVESTQRTNENGIRNRAELASTIRRIANSSVSPS
jgi:hypothetical protein